jgi:UDP-N-acetyl-D-mannosaminuronate dehydrogenase
MQKLLNKIKNGEALIGIIGLGYVGLPLGIAFSKKFQTIGYDINETYIRDLATGISHIIDVPDNVLRESVSKSLYPTNDPK